MRGGASAPAGSPLHCLDSSSARSPSSQERCVGERSQGRREALSQRGQRPGSPPPHPRWPPRCRRPAPCRLPRAPPWCRARLLLRRGPSLACCRVGWACTVAGGRGWGTQEAWVHNGASPRKSPAREPCKTERDLLPQQSSPRRLAGPCSAARRPGAGASGSPPAQQDMLCQAGARPRHPVHNVSRPRHQHARRSQLAQPAVAAGTPAGHYGEVAVGARGRGKQGGAARLEHVAARRGEGLGGGGVSGAGGRDVVGKQAKCLVAALCRGRRCGCPGNSADGPIPGGGVGGRRRA